MKNLTFGISASRSGRTIETNRCGRALLLRTSLATLGLGLALVQGNTALANPALRAQVTQKGDFALIGNTLEQDYANAQDPPVVGTIGGCSLLGPLLSGYEDSAGDCMWRSDDPVSGKAYTGAAVNAGTARSTAVLKVPAGAKVTHAFMYWGGLQQRNGGAAVADKTATVERPGTSPLSVDLTADNTFVQGSFYQSEKDVTSIVQTWGNGAYRVSGVDLADPTGFLDLIGQENESNLGGWYMVVFYEDTTQNLRNLTLFDGFDLVNAGHDQTVSLSGFQVPSAAGFDAKLGVVAFEGGRVHFRRLALLHRRGGVHRERYATHRRDEPPPTTSSTAPIPTSGSTSPTWARRGRRRSTGLSFQNKGNLPQMSGKPHSMTGLDLDVVDVTSKFKPGDSKALMKATTSGDQYLLTAFVTSITTFVPDFSSSSKTGSDINGGSLQPGDLIEYTIVVNNTGSDASIDTYVTDTIPARHHLCAGVDHHHRRRQRWNQDRHRG